MKIGNIYSEIPSALPDELFETILKRKDFKLERIISKGHATAQGQWLNQTDEEWVILLQGTAGIVFEGEAAPFRLNAGDYIHIPAYRKHRVEWTDHEQETVWLALHFSPEK